MTNKGTLWIWLSLLAIRGLVVFCLYWHTQQRDAELQQEAFSAEMQHKPSAHHYKINQVHAAGLNFFVLN